MYRFLTLLVIATLAGPALAGAPTECSGPAGEARLWVKVTNIRNDRGQVVINVYGDKPDEFLEASARVARERVPAKAGAIEACIPVPKAGAYAISVFHDEDGNRKVTKNLLGMPVEGYGFSNDAPVSMMPPGPPRYTDARFQVGTGLTALSITMRY